MPIGAMATAGLQVFALVRRLREELGVNTTCGASNISFGLPNRHGINAAFLPMAIASGMTSAIMNPIRPQEMDAIRAANLLTNNDPWGAAWIRANKPPLAEGEVEAGARGRRERPAAGGDDARPVRTDRGSARSAKSRRPDERRHSRLQICPDRQPAKTSVLDRDTMAGLARVRRVRRSRRFRRSDRRS